MKNAHQRLKGSATWIVTFFLMIALAAPAAAAKPTKVTASHTAKQKPPIQLGTSGGWRYDLANGYCCGGTLGSLVTVGDTQYILSNFHVFAGDVQVGGNNVFAEAGDPIVQPGLIDVGCNENNTQTVALLSSWADPLAPNNIDAAIAQVIPDMVHPEGAILEIGTISSSTLAPSLSLAVKKSGRTSRLTRSKIIGLNATILVNYETECAGSSRGTATFVNQIIIDNRGNKFLAAGDSGSLMVEDVTRNPRAIGLLFAGSSSIAVANPIDEVLNHFGATMVGVARAHGTEVPDSSFEEAKKVQSRHAARLEQIRGGVGHGIGLGRNGEVVIKVYVEKDTAEVRAALPESVDGMPVEIEETGRIVPLSRCQ
jgi:hypothetical protein